MAATTLTSLEAYQGEQSLTVSNGNQILRAPKLPNPELEPVLGQGQMVREWVEIKEVSEMGLARLDDEHASWKGTKIYCYKAKAGWVPELRKEQSVQEQRAVVAVLIDSLMEQMPVPRASGEFDIGYTHANNRGRFVRQTDNQTVLEFLGDPPVKPGEVLFPPKRNPGHRVVPVLHQGHHDQVGVYPHQAETDGHLRLFTIMDTSNGSDARKVIIPASPHPEYPAELVNSKPFPFQSLPTDAITMMRSEKIKGKNHWVAQVVPSGQTSFDAYSTHFHYAGGAISGIVAYKLPNGDIVALDLDGHIQRIVDNAKSLGYDLAFEYVKEVIMNQLKADQRWIPSQGNKAGNRCYIRTVLFPDALGPNLFGIDPEHVESMMFVLTKPVGDYKIAKNQKLTIGLLGPRPVSPKSAQVKDVKNYHDPVKTLAEFKKKTGRKDIAEALFVKDDKTPQEGGSSSIFFIDEISDPPVLVSPDPARTDVLPGRSVNIAMEIAKKLGWKVVGYDYGKKGGKARKLARKIPGLRKLIATDYEKDNLNVDDLLAKAAAGKVKIGMTGTAMGIREVGEVVTGKGESVKIGGQEYSPNMKRLQDIYEAVVSGNHELVHEGDTEIVKELTQKYMQVAVQGSEYLPPEQMVA